MECPKQIQGQGMSLNDQGVNSTYVCMYVDDVAGVVPPGNVVRCSCAKAMQGTMYFEGDTPTRRLNDLIASSILFQWNGTE